MIWEAWLILSKNWVEEHYMPGVFHFTYWPFDFVQPWPSPGMEIHIVAIGVLGGMIALGLFYRFAAVCLFFAFTYVFLLEQTRYLNHFYLVCDRRQLVLPVATTIFAGRDGVIIRYGGTVDYRPTSQAIEAETYGRQDTGNGSGQGWDERAFSAQVAEWAIAVAGETGASVAHSAGSLRRGVGG